MKTILRTVKQTIDGVMRGQIGMLLQTFDIRQLPIILKEITKIIQYLFMATWKVTRMRLGCLFSGGKDSTMQSMKVWAWARNQLP